MGLFSSFRNKTDYKSIVLLELDSIRARYNGLDSFFDKITKFINSKSSDEWNSFFKNHPEKSPKGFLASALSNSIADSLESGAYHIYRGVINENGKHLYSLLMEQLDICVKTGEISEPQKINYLNVLDDNISSVG